MDISGIQKLCFKNLKDGATIVIPPLGGVLGRCGNINPSYFSPNHYISRNHAKITYARGGYVIEDLGSKNGTKINGLPLYKDIRVHIRGGDTIKLANMEFEISYLF